MITEKHKKIACIAYRERVASPSTLTAEGIYAAVEAVLAEQASAAEQGQACKDVHPLRQNSTGNGVEYHCADCGVLIEQPQPAQPPAAAKPCRHGINNDGEFCPDCATTPAGDAVLIEQMLEAFRSATPPNSSPQEKMAAALAVAREGYVSLDVIDDLVCEYGAPEYVRTDDGEAQYWKFSGQELPCADHLGELLIAGIQLRNRLAKPAEQTDEQAIKSVLDHHSPEEYHEERNRKQIASEIFAALRDRKGASA